MFGGRNSDLPRGELSDVFVQITDKSRPTSNRPSCARKEDHAEPDADLEWVDGGWYVKFSPW
jgi:hypothetical protein